MFELELLSNMIVWTALGGSVLIIVIVVVKAVATLAGRASMPETSPIVSEERTCRYCGMVLGEMHKCLNCGAVEQSIGKIKGFKRTRQ